MQETMRAYVLRGEAGQPLGAVEKDFPLAQLAEQPLLVRVSHSAINYKDAMIAGGQGRLVRQLPHIGGVDLAGVVEQDASGRFQPGDAVLITGYDLGVASFGGYAEYARTPAEWGVPLPQGLEASQAMALGTAGLTAMIAVQALEQNGLAPGQGPVVVTGASGGVGSLAVHLLARLGHEVHAVSGKPACAPWLKDLGASEVIPRSAVEDASGKPLLPEKWAAAVDNAGGATLDCLVRSLKREGSVASIGLVGGHGFQGTVYPFILRGVNLLGIDSVLYPYPKRIPAWQRLAELATPEALASITRPISLAQLGDSLTQVLEGGAQGRFVVQLA